MRRYSGQRPLYEAMSRSRSKGKRPSVLAQLRPQLEKLLPQLEKLRQLGGSKLKRPGTGSAPAVEKVPPPPPPPMLRPPRAVEMPPDEPTAPVQTWLRPKALQINGGRIEVSLPYQIGIIIGMGLLLLLMMGFWIGRRVARIDEQSRYESRPIATQAGVEEPVTPPVRQETEPTVEQTSQPAAEPSVERQEPAPAPRRTDATPSNAPTRTGDNLIVLARHTDEKQLEPAQAYFNEHGVLTQIVSFAQVRAVFEQYGLDMKRVPKGDGYMLVTRNLYENPGREGTDGYEVKQRITELGRQYEAPSGFERFAPHYFSDAYGLKIAK